MWELIAFLVIMALLFILIYPYAERARKLDGVDITKIHFSYAEWVVLRRHGIKELTLEMDLVELCRIMKKDTTNKKLSERQRYFAANILNKISGDTLKLPSRDEEDGWTGKPGTSHRCYKADEKNWNSFVS